eukprot:4413890-Pyramimonas_sp.AAC.1
MGRRLHLGSHRRAEFAPHSAEFTPHSAEFAPHNAEFTGDERRTYISNPPNGAAAPLWVPQAAPRELQARARVRCSGYSISSRFSSNYSSQAFSQASIRMLQVSAQRGPPGRACDKIFPMMSTRRHTANDKKWCS